VKLLEGVKLPAAADAGAKKNVAHAVLELKLAAKAAGEGGLGNAGHCESEFFTGVLHSPSEKGLYLS
jgi:hypothetical protein